MKTYTVEIYVRAENESDAIERIEDAFSKDENGTLADEYGINGFGEVKEIDDGFYED